MCEDCKKTYICPNCGKVCKTHRGLEMHLASCKIIPEVELEVKDVNISLLDEYEQSLEVKVEEHDINSEIRTFFGGLGSRSTNCRLDFEKMVKWFRIIYPKSELHFDLDCSSCLQTLVRRMKDYYNKIK